jgi:hypothetical protein
MALFGSLQVSAKFDYFTSSMLVYFTCQDEYVIILGKE